MINVRYTREGARRYRADVGEYSSDEKVREMLRVYVRRLGWLEIEPWVYEPTERVLRQRIKGACEQAVREMRAELETTGAPYALHDVDLWPPVR